MTRIMSRLPAFMLAALVAAQFTIAAPAQPPDAPSDSLDALLRKVQTVRTAQEQLFDRRIAEFSSATADEQQAMVERAESQRSEHEAASQALSEQHSQNEIRINELNGKLVEKAAGLGLSELFGVARQVAGDAAIALQQSLITTQFPRANAPAADELLRLFAESRTVPAPVELQQLWLELHREITASGQVTRYTAPVVQPNGETVSAAVVRIGPFNATADGRFLSYSPPLRTLSVLPRQLPGDFMDVAARFEHASSGYVPGVVDPSRGVLLGLYVERPTLLERIELGETVGYVIIAVGVAAVVVFLYQLIHLIRTRVAVARQLNNLDQPVSDNPLGRVLLAFKGDPDGIEQNFEVVELRISEAVLHEVPRLERFQAFLRLSVAAGPLLGLIGTVVGMIITFQSITEAGSSDPKLMATGIGQAMIATVLGLGIAIPLLFANALLNSLSRTVVQILDEQSTGILAEGIERQQSA